MPLVHLLLVASWACFVGAVFLPALDTGDYALSGWACFRRSITTPQAFPIFGVANLLIVVSPLFVRRLGRSCPGWFATLGTCWLLLAVAMFLFAAWPTDEALDGAERLKPLVGSIAWGFSLVLAAIWLALCWLASRRRI